MKKTHCIPQDNIASYDAWHGSVHVFICSFLSFNIILSGMYQQNNIILLSGMIYQWHHKQTIFLTKQN